jgi:hypothetical protein
MMSDFLSGVVERFFPSLVPTIRDARLFRLEREDRPTPPKDMLARWEPDARVIENYRLPFGSIVIEEAKERDEKTERCAFMWDVDADARRFGFISASRRGDPADREVCILTGELTAFPGGALAEGLDGPDDVVPMLSELHNARLFVVNYAPHSSMLKKPRRLFPAVDTIQLTPLLAKRNLKTNEELRAWCEEQVREAGAKADEIIQRTRDRMTQEIEELCARVAILNLNLHMLLLVRINEPSLFVVEERPIQPLRQPVPGLPRSPWRSHYIVLEPQEIKTRLLGADPNPPSGMKRAPHEKRGHFRRLVSDRYTKKKGSVIWIRPCWVGPKEGVVGKNRYIVRLDADRPPKGETVEAVQEAT